MQIDQGGVGVGAPEGNNVRKSKAVGKFDHEVLDDTELARLVAGFKGSPLYPIVAVAAFTGMRLREVVALRWEDVDLEKQTISVSRATRSNCS